MQQTLRGPLSQFIVPFRACTRTSVLADPWIIACCAVAVCASWDAGAWPTLSAWLA